MTVRISKQFFEDLSGRITDMRFVDVRANGLGDVSYYTEISMAQTDLMTHLLWGDYLKLQELLPEDWCTEVSRFDLHVRLDGLEKTVARVHIRPSTTLLAPPKFSTMPDLYVDEGFLLDPANQAKWPELAAIITACAPVAARMRLQAKWEKIEKDSREFFAAYPSLNAALRVVPQMRMYVPKDYLTKVDAEEVKRGTKTPAVPVDVQALAAFAVEVEMQRSMGVA